MQSTLPSAECPGCGVGSVATEHTCTYTCGFLASPNYPAMYPDSTTVTWNIHIIGDNYIKLEFLDFKVESQLLSCDEDYVDVYNILDGSRDQIGRYCLEIPPPPVLFSYFNQMDVVFTSDSQYSNSGFFAQYSAEHYNLLDYISKQIDKSGKTI